MEHLGFDLFRLVTRQNCLYLLIVLTLNICLIFDLFSTAFFKPRLLLTIPGSSLLFLAPIFFFDG